MIDSVQEEAVEFINARDKPLSLYVFTNNKEPRLAFKTFSLKLQQTFFNYVFSNNDKIKIYNFLKNFKSILSLFEKNYIFDDLLNGNFRFFINFVFAPCV